VGAQRPPDNPEGGAARRRHRRIGLLGGSFNPAHRGHLHLSLLALRHLDLDLVWWLVSPQNPLKSASGMAPFGLRLEAARRVAAADKRIAVRDFEAGRGLHYTADTVMALRRCFPRLRFVWLMGSDNLLQLRHWERWPEIMQSVPVAVFDRPGSSRRALAELPARRFAGRRLPPSAARRLAGRVPPAWVFFPSRLDPLSASRIRAESVAPSAPVEVSPTLSSPAIARLTPRRRRPALPPAVPAGVPRALLDLVVDTLEDGLAEEVVTLDLVGKTTIADFMVVASGRSARQVLALTERLETALSRRVRFSIEGKAQADWVLIDAGDVIIHLFRPEIRAYYNLEKMWAEVLPDGEAARQ
jgi:nicotinate-nucleotide adenylyltransferase